MRAFLAALMTDCTSPGVKPRFIPLATFSLDGRTCQEEEQAGRVRACVHAKKLATFFWSGRREEVVCECVCVSMRAVEEAHRDAQRRHALAHDLERVVGVVHREAAPVPAWSNAAKWRRGRGLAPRSWQF